MAFSVKISFENRFQNTRHGNVKTVSNAFITVYRKIHKANTGTVTHTKCNSRSRGYKPFFMLNSAEHKILNAHKYKI